MHAPPTEAPHPRRVALALLRYFPHGGLQRIAWDVADLLHQRGHHVTLYTQDWQGPQPTTQDGTSPTWEVRTLPASGSTNHARAADFARRLKDCTGPGSSDVTLGFDRLPGLDLYFAGDPCYSARIRRDRPRWHRWLPRSRTFLGLEHGVFGPDEATRILLMNGAEQRVIHGEYGTPESRFRVLPPGYSPSRRRGDLWREQRRSIRAELGAEDSDVLGLALGSDFHRKGFDRAIRALHHALQADSTRRFLLAVVGAGPTKKLRTLARELGVGAHVRWLGPRDDVPALLQGADLLLHPCRSEPAGMVLLEALSAGTPVIVSACAGYACHVADSGAGAVLPEPFQQADLNRALVDLGQGPRDHLCAQALAFTSQMDPQGMIRAVAEEVEGA